MIIKHRIGMELDCVDVDKEIYVMQDDKYSRELEIHLKANGKKYYPPEDCMVLVRYEKPDGRGGAYDTLPDGRKAAIIEGNIVTIGLAPQVCTAVGRVMLMVTLRHQEKELSCFGICVHVQKGVDSKKIGSERYYHVRGFIPQPHDATVGEYIKVVDVDPQGNITAVTTALEVARDGKSAYQYAQEAGFKGTEAEFSTKLAECGRGIYIGAEAPEGDAVDVWIDIDEEPEEIPAGKDGVVDVTGARVGQTIIVTAVDENGRPTAWEAVDYQPRTHYTLPGKVLAENVTPSMMSNSWISYDLVKDYTAVTVVFDGTTYVCPITFVKNITVNGDESFFFIGNYDNRAPEYPFSFFGYIGKNFALVSPYSGHTYSVTTNEYVHKLDEKYLPATGGVAGASDWNASEGEAGHIKNRTHWAESGGAAILEETPLPGGDGTFMLEGDITLEDGKTYRIVYNGTEYMCTAVDGAAVDPEAVGWVMFGNYGAMTGAGDTGEPFVGINIPGMGLQIMDLSGASSCNMGIYDDSEIVHKLDNKFIDAEWMATSKVNKVPVLEEAEYSVTNTGVGNQDMGRYARISEISLESGKKYIVDFDGKSYECTCKFLYQQEITCYWLGNMAFANTDSENTGEPFCISIMKELNSYYFFAAEGTHTMGLYKAEEVANKLPEKFLPEMPVIVSMKSINYETFEMTMSHTGDEVWAAMTEGKLIFMSVMGTLFIPTGGATSGGVGTSVEFAAVLDPTSKCLLDGNAAIVLVEE